MKNQNQFRVVWHPDRTDLPHEPKFNQSLRFSSNDYWWFPIDHLVGYTRSSEHCLELEFTSHTIRMLLLQGTREILIDEILSRKTFLFVPRQLVEDPSEIKGRQLVQHLELAETKEEYQTAEKVQ